MTASSQFTAALDWLTHPFEKNPSVEKPQSFCVDPVFLGKATAPLSDCHIASLVPPRIFAPIEKLPQTCPHIRGRSMREQLERVFLFGFGLRWLSI